MSELNQYIEANYRKLEGQTRELVIDAFEAGQQSQQDNIDELQARIDEALRILDGMRHNGAHRAIDILKGNQDV